MYHDQVWFMHMMVQLGNGLICYHINRTKEIIHMTILIEGKGSVYDKLHYEFLIFLKIYINRIDISLILFTEVPTLDQFFQ